MKLGLILSNDWEIFGNGSGNYFEIQHKPLEALLKTVENHGAKLTVMAEIGQQWGHQRISEQESWANEIASAWEAMLQETVRRKSDVQLQLHTTWLNARYENNGWNLDFSQWDIGGLPPETIEKALKEGKRYLDDLLQPVDPDYECIAFRAGAYCIQPSRIVIQKMLDSGIICDTSVTKGMYDPQFYDYRDAHSHFLPWFASPRDIKYRNDKDEGLLEIPICSYMGIDSPILRRLMFLGRSDLESLAIFYRVHFGVGLDKADRKWFSEKNKQILQEYSRPLKRNMTAKWILSKLATRSPIQLDYDCLPPKIFVRFLKKIYDDKSIAGWRDKEVIIPIMASGHVKFMHNCENIDRILNEVNSSLQGRIVYWTLSDAIKAVLCCEPGYMFSRT